MQDKHKQAMLHQLVCSINECKTLKVEGYIFLWLHLPEGDECGPFLGTVGLFFGANLTMLIISVKKKLNGNLT